MFVTLMHQTLILDTSPRTLRTFTSFLVLLNLEKQLSPEQLVIIKLRSKGPRGWIN